MRILKLLDYLLLFRNHFIRFLKMFYLLTIKIIEIVSKMELVHLLQFAGLTYCVAL